MNNGEVSWHSVETQIAKSSGVDHSGGHCIMLWVLACFISSAGWTVLPSQRVSWNRKYTLWNLQTQLKAVQCEVGSI